MQTILMPIDFSDATGPAVEFVAGAAPAMDAEVCVLYVSDSDMEDPEQGRSVLQPKLDDVADQLKAKGCEAKSLLVFGPPAESIMKQIDASDPSVVVMGSHGHTALYNLVVGSVTHRILRSGKCPLLIVPSPRKEWRRDPDTIDAGNYDDYYGFPGM